MDFQEQVWKAGIEPEHWDGLGRKLRPSWETLRAVMNALGIELSAPEELSSRIDSRERERTARMLEPVVTGTEGGPFQIPVRLAPGAERSGVAMKLRNEDGEESWLHPGLNPGPEGCFVCHLTEDLPCGYYDLEIEAPQGKGSSLLIIAPRQAYQGSPEGDRKWGIFSPLYALKSASGLGSSDFTTLEEMGDWLFEKGGGLLGTLPLFAAFLDNPCDPSPYAPVSRLFWNECYVDPLRAPNWESCQAARTLYFSDNFKQAVQTSREADYVDFAEEMKLRRQLLEHLAWDFFANCPDDQRGLLDEYLESVPEALPYARFRAEKDLRAGWRDGAVRGHPLSADEISRYHLFAQWLAQMQMDHLKEQFLGRGIDLYMDLPLGVHPNGYDAEAYKDIFAQGVSGGAPPDAFFSAGQNWGFRPLHPWRSRESGHLYFRRIIRRLMQVSSILRIDHVMSFHRLYWVPFGFPADQGAYVRYPAEDFYAILKLESHRRKCLVVGEDLGTVPPEVREKMDREGILRMFVGQFEISPDEHPSLHTPSESMVASINTHDTPTFSGFSRGCDIAERVEMGLLSESDLPGEIEWRNRVLRSLSESLGIFYPGPGEEWDSLLPKVLEMWLFQLAESPVRYLLINLEDLWLESRPQNVPGTDQGQKPNWKRKMVRDLDMIKADARISFLLEEVARRRRGER